MLHGNRKPQNAYSGWSPSLPTGFLHKSLSLTQSFPVGQFLSQPNPNRVAIFSHRLEVCASTMLSLMSQRQGPNQSIKSTL